MPGRVRLAVCDLAPDWDPRDNYLTRALRSGGWELTFCQSPAEEPDFVLCGTFGHAALEYPCCRIQYSGEDSWPDLNLYDYAIGFPLLDYDGRYLRLPLYAMRDTWAPALQKHKTPPADVFARAGFCAAVVSNDYSAARNAVMDELFARGLLQSGGGFRNNTGGPVADKQAFQRGFRFALAIENSADPGYCTEKIVDAWAAGAVPVYGGAPLVKQEFNPAAFVCADDYESPAALADALVELSKDRDAFCAICAAPVLLPDSRAAAYTTDAAARDFLGGIVARGPHLRRNRSCWGSIYENDLKYYHTLAQNAARPKPLWRKILKI